MWIKLFYWGRLFEPTAYLVTLISETLYDIKLFVLVVGILLAAFANFFLIINLNTAKEYKYVEDYTGSRAIDAFISVYLISLGEFNLDDYSKGKSSDSALCWIFFIGASFLCLIVFMNMLVAIMGHTFTRVVNEVDESSLYE